MRLCFGFALLILAGSSPLGAAPVADEARALPDAVEADLNEELMELASVTGCSVHVKAVTFIDSGIGMRHAARLARQAVTPDPVSLMVLFDRSTDTLGVSISPALWQRYPMAELVEMLREVIEEARPEGKGVDVRLLDAMAVIQERLTGLEARRKSQAAISQGERTFAMGYASLLAGLTALAMVLMWRRRMRMRREEITHFFPEAEVQPRLGAPFGGGVVAQTTGVGS